MEDHGSFVALDNARDAKLDTSGEVRVQVGSSGGETEFARYRWHNLDPFTGGYIEALFADGVSLVDGAVLPRVPLGFSDLSPETLARIIADCAEVAPDGGLHGHLPTNASAVADALGAGAEFWRRRNKFTFKRFPPLTPYLGDDGKVYLREVGQ